MEKRPVSIDAGAAARIRLLVALATLVVLAPPAYSYTTTMMQPSSLPLWPRSVEWLRAHHGNWLVDEVEHYYYSWKAPAKGGPQLTSLPAVGLGASPAAKARAPHRPAVVPAADRRRCSRTRCPAKACGGAPVLLVRGRPPVLVTTFRTEVDYPRIVAYVAWFDHTRTAVAWYPGRYEPPSAPVRGPMSVPYGQRWRLLATFNGGFIYTDGSNGSSINGRSVRAAQGGPRDAHRLPRRPRRRDDVARRPGRRPAGRIRTPEPAV